MRHFDIAQSWNSCLPRSFDLPKRPCDLLQRFPLLVALLGECLGKMPKNRMTILMPNHHRESPFDQGEGCPSYDSVK